MTVIGKSLEPLITQARPCIINADLDGVLSGMLLQNNAGWRVVGFSNCAGATSDDLWLADSVTNLEDVVFVDLPVVVRDVYVIDQHFLAFTEEDVKRALGDVRKANPNILRGRHFSGGGVGAGYIAKYPFGTVHFVLAGLERLGLLREEGTFALRKDLTGFDSTDLVFRADRVVGNAVRYRPNCLSWARWMMENGGPLSCALFQEIVDGSLAQRQMRESLVGARLRQYGCSRDDGECVALLKDDGGSLGRYLAWLSEALRVDVLRVPLGLRSFGRLSGYRRALQSVPQAAELSRDLLAKGASLFSYAIVTQREVSVTEIRQ